MKLLLALLFSLALLPAANVSAQGEPVQITILAPADGSELSGPEQQIQLGVSGQALPLEGDRWTGDGAFHVRVDGTEVLEATDLRFTLIGIPPGEHVIEVELVGWSGGASNVARSEISIVAVPEPEGRRWMMAETVLIVAAIIFGGLVLLWLFWVRPQRLEPVYDESDQEQEQQEEQRTTGRPGPSTRLEG